MKNERTKKHSSTRPTRSVIKRDVRLEGTHPPGWPVTGPSPLESAVDGQPSTGIASSLDLSIEVPGTKQHASRVGASSADPMQGEYGASRAVSCSPPGISENQGACNDHIRIELELPYRAKNQSKDGGTQASILSAISAKPAPDA